MQVLLLHENAPAAVVRYHETLAFERCRRPSGPSEERGGGVGTSNQQTTSTNIVNDDIVPFSSTSLPVIGARSSMRKIRPGGLPASRLLCTTKNGERSSTIDDRFVELKTPTYPPPPPPPNKTSLFTLCILSLSLFEPAAAYRAATATRGVRRIGAARRLHRCD